MNSKIDSEKGVRQIVSIVPAVLLDRLYLLPPLGLLVCYLLYFAKPTENFVRPSAETSMIIAFAVLLGLVTAGLPKARTFNLAFRPKKRAIFWTVSLGVFWLVASASREKLPLLGLIQGDFSVNYTDFGSFNAVGHSLIVFGFYLVLYHMEPGVKRLALGLGLIAMPVLIVSRFVLVEVLFLLAIHQISRTRLMSIRTAIFFATGAAGFGAISEMRTPVAYLERFWMLSDWMLRLPVFLIWIILYTTSPMLNLVHFLNQGCGGTTDGVLTLSSMLPAFVATRLFTPPDVSKYLYFEYNNVYTFLGKYYLDFGVAGMLAAMVGIVLLYKYIVCSFDRPTRTLFVYPVLFVFFTDAVLFFPTILLFCYLIVFCKSYRYTEAPEQ